MWWLSFELKFYDLIEREPRTGPQLSWEEISKNQFVLIPWTPEYRAVQAGGRLIPGTQRIESPPPHPKAIVGIDLSATGDPQASQSATDGSHHRFRY